MAIPLLLQFAVFTIYVNISSIFMAFQRIDYETNKVVLAGLYNFKVFFVNFGQSDFWPRAIFNSLGYFPVTALITLPLSIFAGYFLYRKIWFHNFFKVVFFLPNIISIIVLGMFFKNMFDPSIGLVNRFLMDGFKVPRGDIPLWFMDKNIAMWMLYLYAVWAGIGYNVILIFGAISRIPIEVMESARLDGIGVFKEIVKIVVPIIWPTITTMTVFCVMTVFSQFMHPLILTPGTPASTQTIAYVIITSVKNGNYYASAAVGLIFTVVAVPIIMLVRRIMERMFDTVET